MLGNKMTMFCVDVTNAHKVEGAGGGNPSEGEVIEVIDWPLSELDKLLLQGSYLDPSTESPEIPETVASLLFAVMWYKQNVLGRKFHQEGPS
ncbi:unnamed protein product [Protopolystoma xenopodis]|uniref:Nudix hydrolase domain-containing protein n=1 Tax=Protopolystoma xenopodis TaxID=117903 RepID=A0A448XQA0_9PLAT|nr:unnamed protein product [Protopolystoma xenopodis]